MGVMKKVSLIVSHSDIVNVISELIYLECFEPIEPEVSMDPPELSDLLKREVMDLDSYEANKEKITLLTTEYTYTLVGWMPAEFEHDLGLALSKLTCAWLVEDPHPESDELVPAYMKHPNLLGKFRSGGRSIFEPLAKKDSFF